MDNYEMDDESTPLVDVLFITGAGVSTSASLKDYVTLDSSWPFDLPRTEATSIFTFRSDPQLFWKAFNYCHPREFFDASPTAIHKYLAELSDSYSMAIATQNIDGLHQKAGSKNVFDLHGNLKELICIEYMNAGGCSSIVPFSDFRDVEIPLCNNCGKVLKPNCSLYGEGVSHMGEVRDLARSAKVLVALGTSLRVAPVNEIFYLGEPYLPSPLHLWVNKHAPSKDFTFSRQLILDVNNSTLFNVLKEQLDSLISKAS